MNDKDEKRHIKTSPLGAAMLDAALGALNEDILEIHQTLNSIKESLPALKGGLNNIVSEESDTLREAFKALPENFDKSFSEKMNDIIGILEAVDKHSNDLENVLKEDISKAINIQTDGAINEINKKLNGFVLTSYFNIFVFGTTCTILGGLFSSVLVWFIFPKLFN